MQEYKFGENHILPAYKTEVKGMFNSIKEIDNPFVQKLIDMKAMVMLFQGELTVLANDVYLLLKLHENEIHLECIAVLSEKRKQGLGTEMMKVLTSVSDEVNIPITIWATHVTGNGWNIAQHLVINTGMKAGNKIPGSKLAGWYETFGFKKLNKVKTGWRMVYLPKTYEQK